MQLKLQNVIRVSEIEYKVRVFTGDISGAGTDSNVFCCLYGDKGDSGERELKDSATNMNKFERNKVSSWDSIS